MRKFITGAVLCCWIILEASCRHTTPSGGRIISRDTMKVLLWEMFLADSYNEGRVYKDSNFRHDSAYATLYTKIFRAHHITREEFSESYDYYLTQPSVMRSIVDSIVSEKQGRDQMKRGLFQTPNHPPGHVVPVPPVTTPLHQPPGGHPGSPPGPPAQPNKQPANPSPPKPRERPAPLGGTTPVQ